MRTLLIVILRETPLLLANGFFRGVDPKAVNTIVPNSIHELLLYISMSVLL